jgi:hypothetical protein
MLAEGNSRFAVSLGSDHRNVWIPGIHAQIKTALRAAEEVQFA